LLIFENVRSLYEHAGGDQTLHRLEELFYTKVLSDPVLNTLFTERRRAVRCALHGDAG
jgi:truncated hemoglobin YjbI